MKKKMVVLLSLVVLLLQYFLPASLIIAQEVEETRGVYFLTEQGEGNDFEGQKQKISETHQEDWVILDPVNVVGVSNGQRQERVLFPIYQGGHLYQLIETNESISVPDEVVDFIETNSRKSTYIEPIGITFIDDVWYGALGDKWYNLDVHAPAEDMIETADLYVNGYTINLYSHYQGQKKYESTVQRSEATQDSTFIEESLATVSDETTDEVKEKTNAEETNPSQEEPAAETAPFNQKQEETNDRDKVSSSLNRNTAEKIQSEWGNVDYTNGLIDASNSEGNVSVTTTGQYRITKTDFYFLIKSKDGKYAYAKELYTNSYSHPSRVCLGNIGTDGVHYGLLGGEQGTATDNSSSASIKTIQFQFRPEFYQFYDVKSKEDPYKNQNVHTFLNWLNFWTENEISVVQATHVELYVAQKNNEIQPWHFFQEGRTSNKEQFFSLALDEVTRLEFELNARSNHRITIYQEDETKVFETNHSTGKQTFTIDLPKGNYYIAMTGVKAQTSIQIRRHQFNDFQLSIDTNADRTQIYLNGVFNQELTTIYAPHHRSLHLPTAVDVTNTLSSTWRTTKGKYPILDTLFGKNYLLGTSLKEATYPYLGHLPMGSTSLSKPLQYVGNGQFYTDAQIVQFGPQPRFAITGTTLLLAMAGLLVCYSAYVIHTTQLQLTIPSVFRDFEVGSWKEIDAFKYHGTITHEGKTYGVNDETGEIKDTTTEEDLPKNVISDEIRKAAAGASQLAINEIKNNLKELQIEKIADEYEWYTFKDLVQDEMEGYGNRRGHTIEKHVMKSDNYLNDRLARENVLFASTYYGVVEALIAINVTKLKHPETFQNVVNQKGQFVETPFRLGRGLNKHEATWDRLPNNQLYLMPSSSEKGYRVLTSYPMYIK